MCYSVLMKLSSYAKRSGSVTTRPGVCGNGARFLAINFLETQVDRLISWCNAQGWSVSKVVKEWGSGINDQRPRFLALLTDPKIGHIVVEHKDRASRFGVVYIQTLLAMQGRELVIVNTAATAEDDLMGYARGHHHLVLRSALRPQAR